MLRLGLLGGPLDASHHADERDATTNAPIEVEHRQSSFILEAQLRAELGLAASDTLGLALGIELPLRLFDTSIRYVDHQGREVDIAGDGVHHRNETLVGPGDPMVELHGAWTLDAWTFEARLGVRLPVGRSEPDRSSSATRLAHQHFQFGRHLRSVLALSLTHQLEDVAPRCGPRRAGPLCHPAEAGDRYAGLGDEPALTSSRFTSADLQHGPPSAGSASRPTMATVGAAIAGAFGACVEPAGGGLGLTARVRSTPTWSAGSSTIRCSSSSLSAVRSTCGPGPTTRPRRAPPPKKLAGADIADLGPPARLWRSNRCRARYGLDSTRPGVARARCSMRRRRAGRRASDGLAIRRLDVVDGLSMARLLAPGGHALPTCAWSGATAAR
jgi:hypothetical protein